MKFKLLTVFWGSQFADLFLRLATRSLLARGNFADLGRKYPTAWVICTTPDNAARIQHSPVFEALCRIGKVELSFFDPSEINPNNPSSHWTIWRKEIARAAEAEEYVIYIMPDIIYASGTLLEWAATMAAGYRAIFTPAVQVVLESVLEEVELSYPSQTDLKIELDVATLTRLSLKHLHPYHLCMLRDSDRWVRHPESVGYLVPKGGFLQRVIGSHQLCFDPNFFEYNHSYTPMDQLDRIAFLPCTAISAEPFLKFMSLYFRPWAMTSDRLSNLGWWLHTFTTPANDIESAISYLFPASRDCSPASFKRAHAAGDFYRTQCIAVRTIYRIWLQLNAMGCRRAAQLLATAHYAGRLRRRKLLSIPTTVLVPSDEALERFGKSWLSDVEDGQGAALLARIYAHCIAGEQRFKVGTEIFVMSGGEIITLPPGKYGPDDAGFSGRIVSGPIQVDGFTLYGIDFVVRPRKGAPAAGAAQRLNERKARPVTPLRIASSGVVAMRPLLIHPSLTPADPSSRANGLQPPPDETAEQEVCLSVRSNGPERKYDGDAKQLRAMVKDFLDLPQQEAGDWSRALRNDPASVLVSQLRFYPARTSLLRQIYRARVKRLSNAYARIRQIPIFGLIVPTAYRAVGGVVTTAYSGMRTVTLGADPLVRRGLRACRSAWVRVASRFWQIGRTINRFAQAATAKKKAVFASKRAEAPSTASIVKSGPSAAELFRSAQIEIGLQALRELLTSFSPCVRYPLVELNKNAPSPLEYLNRTLRNLGIDLNPRTLLETVLAKDPAYAEAWVESAHQYFETGRYSDATNACLRSLASPLRETYEQDNPNPHAEAASLIAECLARAGLVHEAIIAYRKSFLIQEYQPIHHAACGHLLWKLGRTDEAIHHFNQGMPFHGPQANLPKLPRNIDELVIPLPGARQKICEASQLT